jgi:hypothetical protein
MKNKEEQMAHNRLNGLKQEQTAVEWLVEQLNNNLDINHSWRATEYIHQAKEIEKEQIEIAYRTGWINYLPNTNAEEYYNETFKNK